METFAIVIQLEIEVRVAVMVSALHVWLSPLVQWGFGVASRPVEGVMEVAVESAVDPHVPMEAVVSVLAVAALAPALIEIAESARAVDLDEFRELSVQKNGRKGKKLV